MNDEFDKQMIRHALSLAKQGQQLGEVPVGAVITCDNVVIATAFNAPIDCCDATAHAEITAIRQACRHFDNYRLPKNCTLYVSLEPCTMCLGAIIHARLSRLVFGAYEPKAGVITSQENFAQKSYFNHHLDITGGVLADECGALLSDFFKQRRALKKLDAKADKILRKDSFELTKT